MNKREKINYIKKSIKDSNITPPSVKPIIAHYLIQRMSRFDMDDETVISDVESIMNCMHYVKFVYSSEIPPLE